MYLLVIYPLKKWKSNQSVEDNLGIQNLEGNSHPGESSENLENSKHLIESNLNIPESNDKIPQPQEEILSGASESLDASPLPIPPDPFTGDEIQLEPLVPDDLPEWLTDVKPTEKTPAKVKPRSVTPVEDDGTPKPEKGNLPVWLAALRPVESVEMASTPEEKTPEADAVEENQAANMISGISTATFAGKPSDLGSGLKVTNRQKTNAGLLSMIASNTEAVEESEKFATTGFKNTLWRSLLAVVFISVALLGGTILNGYGLQPALFPGEVVHTFDRINSIPADKTIFDCWRF